MTHAQFQAECDLILSGMREMPPWFLNCPIQCIYLRECKYGYWCDTNQKPHRHSLCPRRFTERRMKLRRERWEIEQREIVRKQKVGVAHD